MRTKLNNNGFALLEALLFIVVIIVLIGLGYFGYNRMKGNQSTKAHASNWTTLYLRPLAGTPPSLSPLPTGKACKTRIVSAVVGGDASVTYQVQFALTNTNPQYRTTQVKVGQYTGSGPTATLLNTTYTSWYANTYQGFTIKVPSPTSPTFAFASVELIGPMGSPIWEWSTNSTGGATLIYPNTLADC